MGKLCGSFQNYFSFIYFISAVLHMFDIEARLMTCSLHLELKVEMFKVVPRSCGYMVDIARIYKRLNDAYQKSMYTNFFLSVQICWVHNTVEVMPAFHIY